jgi:hypothetical protein
MVNNLFFRFEVILCKQSKWKQILTSSHVQGLLLEYLGLLLLESTLPRILFELGNIFDPTIKGFPSITRIALIMS